MKKIHIVLLSVLGIIILVLGYLGLVPGLSYIMGATRAKDLGVRYTEADLRSYTEKAGVTEIDIEPTGNPRTDLVFEGSHKVTSYSTSEELTARMNNLESFAYNPITNQQVLIHDDGTGEISGNMRLSGIADAARSIGIPEDEVKTIERVAGAAKFLTPNPAFYAKGSVKVVNNQIEMDVSEVKFNRINIPLSKSSNEVTGMAIDEGSFSEIPLDDAEDYFEKIIRRISGLDVRSLEFIDGQMYFDGSIPSTIKKVMDD